MALLTEFLTNNAPNKFCSACLAFALKVPVKTVRTAITSVAAIIVVAQDEARCWSCTRRTIVYGLTPAGTKAPDQAIADFFRRWAGTGICHLCLMRTVNLSYDMTQKGVWQLRMQGVVNVQPGECTLCDQRRLVITPSRLED